MPSKHQPGCPCQQCKGKTCNLTVETNWCGCVAPGLITVTVQQGSAQGAVLCQGTADGNGNFVCAVPGPGNYYCSASVSTSGYINVPATVTVIGAVNGICDPQYALTVICPDQLTASGFWGAVTIYPMQPGNAACGGPSPYSYTGTVNYAYDGSCGCGGATVPITVCVGVCNEGPATFSASFPSYPVIGPPLECPGPGPNTSIQGHLPIGTAMLQNTCYPVNLSGTVMQTLSLETLIGFMLGVCDGPWSFAMAVTQ